MIFTENISLKEQNFIITNIDNELFNNPAYNNGENVFIEVNDISDITQLEEMSKTGQFNEIAEETNSISLKEFSIYKQIINLKNFYTNINVEDEIRKFLIDNSDLINLIKFIPSIIKKYFPGATLSLNYFKYPDTGEENLVIYINNKLKSKIKKNIIKEINRQNEILTEFFKNYWINASDGINNRISIDIKPYV
jgi:S-adenosylhomocysteine hydrolase